MGHEDKIRNLKDPKIFTRSPLRIAVFYGETRPNMEGSAVLYGDTHVIDPSILSLGLCCLLCHLCSNLPFNLLVASDGGGSQRIAQVWELSLIIVGLPTCLTTCTIQMTMYAPLLCLWLCSIHSVNEAC